MTKPAELTMNRFDYEKQVWDEKAHIKKAGYVDGADERLLRFLKHNRLGVSLNGRVLDCGCGVGDLSLALARQGATVVGTDISPTSINMAREHAKRLDLAERAEFQVMRLESMGFEDGSFDLIVGKWILHHVDLDQAGPEINRVLKPGGRAVFLENNARNWILMAARKHLAGRFGIPKKSDDLEHPLRPADIDRLRPVFPGGVQCVHSQFHFIRMFDKYIFRRKIKPLTRIFAAMDNMLFRLLPVLGRYSYRQIVILQK